MKNIQVIDCADNCAYDIFACTEEEFALIFPQDGQDIEFIEDLLARLDEDAQRDLFDAIWKRPVRKPQVTGIHGTLFYQRLDKKRFYPRKREADLDAAGRGWTHG